MRNLKLKAALKTILSDCPDRPNQGECQFPVVDLVLSLNTACFGVFFNWKRTYLTERKREAKNLQNLLAFSKSSPSFLSVTSFSPRKAVLSFPLLVHDLCGTPQSSALPCQQLRVLLLYFCAFSSWTNNCVSSVSSTDDLMWSEHHSPWHTFPLVWYPCPTWVSRRKILSSGSLPWAPH